MRRSGRMLILLALAGTGAAGCIKDTRPTADRSGGLESTAPKVQAPLQDRCAAHGTSSLRGNCDEARMLAQTYVRKLAPGDEICIEGGFGDEPGPSCQARAAVVDVGTNLVLVQVRDAQPSSRWFRHVMGEVWYEEGALVDLYLAEHGY